MEKFKDKKIVIGLLIISTIVISIVGAYAYFLASMGETVNEKLIVKAGTLQLIFRDTYEIVTNTEKTMNFEDTVTKEFEIENTGSMTVFAILSWDNIVNTYLNESLTYTLEYRLKDSEEDWKKVTTIENTVPRSETPSKIDLADQIRIPSKTTYTFKITIKLEDLEDIDQTQDLGATLSTKFTLEEDNVIINSDTVREKLMLTMKSVSPDFFRNATTDETSDGLYALNDDYGISYYFRGATNNNYVKFGRNKDGEDMWWRIIRINGDGSLRIQYDGTQGWANGIANENRLPIKNQPWNTEFADVKYIGYMFGGAQGVASTSREEAERNETNSDVKTVLDEWYLENIKRTGYSRFLSDSIFCNDRRSPTNSGWPDANNLGFGSNTTEYMGRWKVVGGASTWIDPQEISFTCPQNNDRFTVSIENGNGALTFPVGLITLDETVAAGAGRYYSVNTDYYLYKGTNYWSMSPMNSFNGSQPGGISSIGEGTYIGNMSFTPLGVSPVINIAGRYAIRMQGLGTIENPYIIAP